MLSSVLGAPFGFDASTTRQHAIAFASKRQQPQPCKPSTQHEDNNTNLVTQDMPLHQPNKLPKEITPEQLPIMTDCQNIFATAAPEFLTTLEYIHPKDPDYVVKWNRYIAKTRGQIEELEREMQNPCYSAEEREHNLMLLEIAKKDWICLEEAMAMGAHIEEKVEQSNALDRQIALMLERKANLEEEIAVKVEILKDTHRRFGSERVTYVEEAIEQKADEKKKAGFRGKLHKAKSMFSLRGRGGK